MGGLATCLAISLLYVVPMNLFGGSRSRDDPHTIKRRMLCVLGSCLLAWLPVLILAKVNPTSACCSQETFSYWPAVACCSCVVHAEA